MLRPVFRKKLWPLNKWKLQKLNHSKIRFWESSLFYRSRPAFSRKKLLIFEFWLFLETFWIFYWNVLSNLIWKFQSTEAFAWFFFRRSFYFLILCKKKARSLKKFQNLKTFHSSHKGFGQSLIFEITHFVQHQYNKFKKY